MDENAVKHFNEYIKELTNEALYSHKKHVEGIIDTFQGKRRLIDKEIELRKP